MVALVLEVSNGALLHIALCSLSNSMLFENVVRILTFNVLLVTVLVATVAALRAPRPRSMAYLVLARSQTIPQNGRRAWRTNRLGAGKWPPRRSHIPGRRSARRARAAAAAFDSTFAGGRENVAIVNAVVAGRKISLWALEALA